MAQAASSAMEVYSKLELPVCHSPYQFLALINGEHIGLLLVNLKSTSVAAKDDSQFLSFRMMNFSLGGCPSYCLLFYAASSTCSYLRLERDLNRQLGILDQDSSVSSSGSVNSEYGCKRRPGEKVPH